MRGDPCSCTPPLPDLGRNNLEADARDSKIKGFGPGGYQAPCMVENQELKQDLEGEC